MKVVMPSLRRFGGLVDEEAGLASAKQSFLPFGDAAYASQSPNCPSRLGWALAGAAAGLAAAGAGAAGLGAAAAGFGAAGFGAAGFGAAAGAGFEFCVCADAGDIRSKAANAAHPEIGRFIRASPQWADYQTNRGYRNNAPKSAL
jgi:hypothetical protein